MESKPLPVPHAGMISEKTLAIHHDKLYAGYVTKSNEIRTKLEALEKGGDVSTANQSYSELRALKDGETFATNGVYLHEYYFDTLDGNGQPVEGAFKEAILAKHGSWENFVAYLTACGMASRGWAVLAWDMQAKELRVYQADAHNQGGVWGCVPVLVLDVYEHAYFIDFGSDRKAYIQNWLTTVNWTKVEERFNKVKGL